jgi:hypothetical protein
MILAGLYPDAIKESHKPNNGKIIRDGCHEGCSHPTLVYLDDNLVLFALEYV